MDFTLYSRYGKVWVQDEVQNLYHHFCQGRDLKYLCEVLNRPPAGVLSKLCQYKWLICDHTRNRYYYAEEIMPLNSNELELKLETKTTLGGVDISRLSDQKIFDKILQLEAEVVRLNNMKVPCTKCNIHIAKLQKTIKELAEFVDGRP